MKTHSVFILDKSGSMAIAAAGVISGFNEQVQTLKRLAQTKDITVSLVTFNDEVFEVLWKAPPEQLQEISPEDYAPNGGTHMNDAIGHAVTKLLAEAAHEEGEVRFDVTIITDGATYGDVEFNAESIRALKDQCEKKKNWTFSFTGPSKKFAEDVVHTYGFAAGNASFFNAHSADGANTAFRKMGECRTAYMCSSDLSSKSLYSADGVVADFTVPNNSEPVVGVTTAGTTSVSVSPLVMGLNPKMARVRGWEKKA